MSDFSSPHCAHGRAIVIATTLLVREGPGAQYAVVGRLAEGAQVDVWMLTDGWCRVQAADGLTGFVSFAWLRVLGVLTD